MCYLLRKTGAEYAELKGFLWRTVYMVVLELSCR